MFLLLLHCPWIFFFAELQGQQLIFDPLLDVFQQIQSRNVFLLHAQSILGCLFGYPQYFCLQSRIEIRNLIFIRGLLQLLDLFLKEDRLFLQVHLAVEQLILLEYQILLDMVEPRLRLLHLLLNFFEICDEEKI